MTATPDIAIGQHSIAGRKEENQDSYGILLPDGDLLAFKGMAAAIADGISGSAAAKEASETCIKNLFTDYFSTPESWGVATSVGRVLGALNRWLFAQSLSRYGSEGAMMSTLSCLILKERTAHIFHIGDSRIWLLRDGRLRPLTRDHRRPLAGGHGHLLRAMGGEANIRIDTAAHEVREGDIFLFTTDGVHDFISPADMAAVIAGHEGEEEAAAREIVRMAHEAGSPDNLTCQILRIRSLPPVAAMTGGRNLPFPPPLQGGMRIDGYRILREIHASARSEVFLAEDEETGRRIMLKCLSRNFEDDEEAIARFLREEWVARRIASPHVLRLYDPGGRRRFLYLVGEYIEGQSLRQWMNDHPEPALTDIRPLIEQIVRGLRAFHRREMFHGDLKPENILIDEDGTVKLIDFGSVTIAGLPGPHPAHPLGSVDYTAPECLGGRPPDKAADLFALGVIAYEMLTGHHPYGRGFRSAHDVKNRHYVPLSRHRPDIPDWIDGALRQAVARDPARRQEALSAFIADLTTPNPAHIPADSRPWLERDPAGFWKAAAALALAGDLILLALLFG